MTRALLYACVDPGPSTPSPAWDDLESAASALWDAGVHVVPVKLTADCTSLSVLSEREAFGHASAAFADDVADRGGGAWFLARPLGQAGPPRLKTLVKIAKSKGWHVAAMTSEGAPLVPEEMTADAAPDVYLPPAPRAPLRRETDGGAEASTDWSRWAQQVAAALAAWDEKQRGREQSPVRLRRPLLSICVTTYNRAAWLAHSLPLILEQTAPYRDIVEVVVCDNASEDATPAVAATFQHHSHFSFHRNEKNVGMLGNLGASCDRARGRYVWVIGDDDLMVEGAVERVLSAIALHPETELLYTNYAYTRFDRPEDLTDVSQVIRSARAISSEMRDEYTDRVSAIATKSENCFTAIYCLIYREDHARRAYHQDVSGRPFSSLLTTVPTAEYVCRELLDRPGYWIGDPCVVVNMNVSWLRYASLFILERFPELFDLMQQEGVDATRMDALRSRHVRNIPGWFRQIYLGSHRENLPFFSAERLVRRFGHLSAFRARWPELRKVYGKAFGQGRVEDPQLTPERLEAILSDVAGGRV